MSAGSGRPLLPPLFDGIWYKFLWHSWWYLPSAATRSLIHARRWIFCSPHSSPPHAAIFNFWRVAKLIVSKLIHEYLLYDWPDFYLNRIKILSPVSAKPVQQHIRFVLGQVNIQERQDEFELGVHVATGKCAVFCSKKQFLTSEEGWEVHRRQLESK